MASILMDFVKHAHVLPVRISRSSLDLFVTSDNCTVQYYFLDEAKQYFITSSQLRGISLRRVIR